jgi:hypothetical protein
MFGEASETVEYLLCQELSSNREHEFCMDTGAVSLSEVMKVFEKSGDGNVISLNDGKDHLVGSAISKSNRKSWRGAFRDGKDSRPRADSLTS